MTKRDKRLERIRRNPKNVGVETLEQVLADYGFERREGKGSHTVFQHSQESTPLVVAAHGQHVPVYIVKQVLAAIDRIKAQEVEESADESDESSDDEDTDD